jgi:protein disulfide-isomerase A6
VVLFLPHILDSMAQGRNDYIALVKDLAKDFRGKPMQFLWTEAGAQPELETALDLSNYPSMGVVQVNKQASSALRLSWSKKNIKSYLDGLISGSERLAKLGSIPKVFTVPAWDGKDGEAPAEEINLADLMKD